MSENQFENEMHYQASMNLFHAMLNKKLITDEQYLLIKQKMLDKYNPLLGTLFA